MLPQLSLLAGAHTNADPIEEAPVAVIFGLKTRIFRWSRWSLLCGILSLRGTQERCCGLKHVSGASASSGVTSKRLKFQF